MMFISEKASRSSFPIAGFLFSIAVASTGLFGCATGDLHKEISELTASYTQMRYDGNFRTDSSFASRLAEMRGKLLEEGDLDLSDQVLAMEIEWNMLAQNLDSVGHKLETLESSNSSAKNDEHIWLRSYYLASTEEGEKALTILESVKIDSLDYYSWVKFNWLIASIYEDFAYQSDSTSRIENFDQAKKYYARAIQVQVPGDAADYFVESTMHLGNINFIQGSISVSRTLYQSGLEIAINNEVGRLVPFGYYHLGKVDQSEDSLENALENYRKGLKFAKRLGESGAFVQGLFERKISELQ